MALTKDDLQAIQQVVVETTMPMFEQVFDRFDGLETRMDRAESKIDGIENRLDRMDNRLDGIDSRLDRMEATQEEHTKILNDHSNRLRRLEEKVDTIDGRFEAVENDIKELYQMVADLQQQKSGKLSKLSAEQKVIKAYQDIVLVAKELNITLPIK